MIVGLTGLMGSGKDTAADAILKEFPKFKRYALAGPIKELAERWLGLTTDYNARGIKESLVAFSMKEENFECLDILVYDMFKDHLMMDMPMAKKVAKKIFEVVLKDNMYCNVNEEEVSAQMLVTTPRRIWQIIGTEGFREVVSDTFWLDIAPVKEAVITDIRFPNEALWFDSDEKNIIIEIVRDSLPKTEGVVHKSEQGIPSELVDMCFYNDSSILKLQDSVVDHVADHVSLYNHNMR